MTWDELRNKMSAATSRPPDTIPNAGTPEFYALLTDLETSHPDLAHEITQWLLKPYEQPVPAHDELRAEARRANVRERLTRWMFKQDPTQPHRRRTNRSTILVLVGGTVLALMFVFQGRQTPLSRTAGVTRPSVTTAVSPSASTSPATPRAERRTARPDHARADPVYAVHHAPAEPAAAQSVGTAVRSGCGDSAPGALRICRRSAGRG